MSETNDNGLICFTNCLLTLEDGQLHNRDLWVDTNRGVIVDAQKTFFASRQRPSRTIDLGGNILSPGLIDAQINGAYGFDFSIYSGDDEEYERSLRKVSEKIVETGVTSLLPTIITQERSLYPKLLKLLQPRSFSGSASLLGWHAEGPFLQPAKKGAHAAEFLTTAPEGIKSFESIYGADNLSALPDSSTSFVRMITAAPELRGVSESITELVRNRGIKFSIGHSIASSKIAVEAVLHGANMITHLFNAMPQLHHRDPAIIGLLGAGGPYSRMELGTGVRGEKKPSVHPTLVKVIGTSTPIAPSGISKAPLKPLVVASEALDDLPTPPQTPSTHTVTGSFELSQLNTRLSSSGFIKTKSDASSIGVLDPEFDRPYYGIIVDGIHSHPNSVRLAYNTHPEGCILVTDAMSMLDPHLPDGVHEWRDGKRLIKDGDRLSIEGTDTLAGSVVTLDKCIRNFSLFTSESFAKSILCATLHPAKCLGIENKKGTLRAGADADLTVFSPIDGQVLSTWVAGKQVWSRK